MIHATGTLDTNTCTRTCMSMYKLYLAGYIFCQVHGSIGDRGGTVVKVLCYKSEGRWFDCRWCHWNISLT